MGTPNTYWFECPLCGERTYVQSYGGECETKPLADVCECQAKTLDGEIAHCNSCCSAIVMSLTKTSKQAAIVTPVLCDSRESVKLLSA